jgi:hypothetical protein
MKRGDRALEYGIHGYGRSADLPMHYIAAGAGSTTDTAHRVFLVLHN